MAVDESFEERCLRILASAISSEADYEAARFLIDQGYADGRYRLGKGRETYGKVISLAWIGPTGAGQLLAERLSAGAKFDQASCRAKQHREHGCEDGRERVDKNSSGAPKQSSNLVTQAATVGGALVLAMLLYLVRTHLGIPL